MNGDLMKELFMNDKIPVIFAILVLAGLATVNPDKQSLLHFLSMLASGLFGLVTGINMGKDSSSSKPFKNPTHSFHK